MQAGSVFGTVQYFDQPKLKSHENWVTEDPIILSINVERGCLLRLGFNDYLNQVVFPSNNEDKLMTNQAESISDQLENTSLKAVIEKSFPPHILKFLKESKLFSLDTNYDVEANRKDVMHDFPRRFDSYNLQEDFALMSSGDGDSNMGSGFSTVFPSRNSSFSIRVPGGGPEVVTPSTPRSDVPDDTIIKDDFNAAALLSQVGTGAAPLKVREA